MSAKASSHCKAGCFLAGLLTVFLQSGMCLSLPAQNTKSNGNLTFSTSAPPDNPPPIISDVSATGFDLHTKTIVWKTHEASDSQVEYGTTTAYGSATALDPSMVTSHSQLLTGLAAGKIYHFRVNSRDASGELAGSADFTFCTAFFESEPPVISAVSVSGITLSTATITWQTNEASDSQVDYGTAISYSYSNSTSLNPTLVTSHSQIIVGLAGNTKYHFRVKTRDNEGNLAVSRDYIFTTAGGTPPAPPLISALKPNAEPHIRLYPDHGRPGGSCVLCIWHERPENSLGSSSSDHPLKWSLRTVPASSTNNNQTWASCTQLILTTPCSPALKKRWSWVPARG